ncbi:MAG: large-conductance mechanosensitive channel protein MscL [Pirellulaceae bacterium]|nr:large-conductance mechanosensitive channel protein MscL [Pirellulaceae bacterium]
MSLIKEFREFAMRGNVVDLAVGVVIGGAFGKIVTSLVGDVIMPAVGKIVGNVDFSRYKLVLTQAAEGKEEVAIRFGTFGQTVFDFTVVAAAIFMVIKLMNAAKRKEAAAPAAPAPTPDDILLLREIRDELKKR